MPSRRPRFQFSLLALFCWTLALSVFFGLAKVPWPMNAYVAPLYAAVLAGYAGSRSPWLAAIAGGLSCLAAVYLLIGLEGSQSAKWDVLHIPRVAGCCCFPIGAYVGLAVGMAKRDYHNVRRFQSRLESLYQEIARPGPPAKAPSKPAAPDPDAQPKSDE